MLCGRSNEADGRNGGAHQRYEEDVLLEGIDLLKAGREGKGEQEREQDLDAGQRHPKPLQQLTELPVDPLLGALARAWILRCDLASLVRFRVASCGRHAAALPAAAAHIRDAAWYGEAATGESC